MKYLGILFCLVFMSSCELTPEQQANWEKFDKKLDSLAATPQFSNAATSEYVNFLREKVFLTQHKWPHFNLLLDDIPKPANI